MYYSYIEIEYVATSFSPARTDLALKLLRALDRLIAGEKHISLLGALSPINPTCMHLKLDLICSGRVPFPGAMAMVVVLVVSLRQAWKAY
jgi:hypothetical protein